MARAVFLKAALASFCLSATLNPGLLHAEPGARGKGEDSASSSSVSKSAGAKELFKEGRKLVEKGDYEGACSKFEQSLELEDGVGTRFNLADCYEHLGRTASAYELFIEVAEESKQEKQGQREVVARGRADAIAPKLSRLTVKVEAQERVLQVRRDGKKLAARDLGTPVALDPGSYEITASAPGLEEWTSKVDVPSGPIVVQVTVPTLEPEAQKVVAPPAKEPEKKVETAPKPVEPKAEDPRGERRLQTATVILGGAGVAAMVAAATFGLQFQTSNADARAVCPGRNTCDEDEGEEAIRLHESLVDDAKKARTLAYVSAGAGTVLLGTALYLYLNSGSEEPPKHALRALPAVGTDGSWGANLVGSF